MIQLAGWTTYSVLIWSLKASLLVLYTRLTSRLGKNYQYYIYFGIFFIAATWITAILVVLAGCRPLHKYWQISPDPGVNCQIASSPTIIWVYNSLNVATDAYLITVPMPLLWQSRMKLKRKAGLVLLFSGGAGVIAFSTVRTTIIARDPVNGKLLV
ncbi:putative integral membrane protein PTH11 [Rosellinia necatrix]|uniref:Putative integral membrane protein PTH11 n=1 Tax=Rosellinia necatrix TaxID=77044 RepID=A0A1S7UJW6_ROSNE|nr:putative integral membrane protein PTH11 [Rosellinia necatrix]